jgi:hypothetical protein
MPLSPATMEDAPPTVINSINVEHPLLLWTKITPGDEIFIRGYGVQEVTGSVECKTNDGLILWLRNNLNERKLIHYRDCLFFKVTYHSSAEAD